MVFVAAAVHVVIVNSFKPTGSFTLSLSEHNRSTNHSLVCGRRLACFVIVRGEF